MQCEGKKRKYLTSFVGCNIIQIIFYACKPYVIKTDLITLLFHMQE